MPLALSRKEIVLVRINEFLKSLNSDVVATLSGEKIEVELEGSPWELFNNQEHYPYTMEEFEELMNKNNCSYEMKSGHTLEVYFN